MDQAYSGQAAVDTVAQRFMTSGVHALGPERRMNSPGASIMVL
jgi:hypothetical protein